MTKKKNVELTISDETIGNVINEVIDEAYDEQLYTDVHSFEKGEPLTDDGPYHKCSQTDGYCQTLASLLKQSGDRGYGMFAMKVVSIGYEGRLITSDIGVEYRTKNGYSGSLMFRFCPFCGESLSWIRYQDEDDFKGRIIKGNE